jgi:hypothetical protein
MQGQNHYEQSPWHIRDYGRSAPAATVISVW